MWGEGGREVLRWGESEKEFVSGIGNREREREDKEDWGKRGEFWI